MISASYHLSSFFLADTLEGMEFLKNVRLFL